MATVADNNVTNEKILLVDDNPTNLQVLYQTLSGRGYKLLVAKNGESALAVARKAAPHLILLDIMMPDIDGYEVCRRLKEDENTSEIPIIFLSALDETEDKVRGLDLGAVDYIAKPFQADEVIARVNTHLTIYRLKREVEQQKAELERELEIVSEVQRDLLPKQLPTIKGMKLAAYYKTSRYAGGDYYDIIRLEDNQWGIMIADAEGHSAPAAVRMAMTCALLRGYHESATDPAALLRDVNETLCDVMEGSFVTALYCVYDSTLRSLRMARAGHMPAVLCRPGEGRAVELSCDGVHPLGIFPYEHVPVTEAPLRSGDHVLFYTDGLTERFNPRGEMYGLDRLLTRFQGSTSSEPQEVLDAIMADAERFADGLPAEDDQALLLCVIE
ncbi:MAG: SpoIIE family protein phosphatase [Deltaproteobacteria bacterium]|nr:SpoIIE family protein phosphatase [Deltaproteobacteria bacterium]MBW2072569.1 SpoIIE family protein phosphatase [Deltaproteobacteria bacterium]